MSASAPISVHELKYGGIVRQDSITGKYGIGYTGISPQNPNAPIPVKNPLREKVTVHIPADGRNVEMNPGETIELSVDAYRLGSPKVVAVAGRFFEEPFALNEEAKEV